MSLASTFWFWALREGPPTCSRRGRQITQIDHECLCYWNCAYQISFTVQEIVYNIYLLQNEVGFQPGLSAVRRPVAKTQKIISRAFPSRRSVQIPTDSKTRGP
jgi:hypothetical protein